QNLQTTPFHEPWPRTNLWVNGAFLGDGRLYGRIGIVLCGPFVTSCGGLPKTARGLLKAQRQTFLTKHRHTRKVARIQYANDRRLWWSRVAVRSLKVRLQPLHQ